MNDDQGQQPDQPLAAQTSPELNSLKEELARISKRSEEYLEGWKRAKADYLNLQRESEKRNTEFIQYANAALLAGLLPIIDHFKLALRHIPVEHQQEPWVAGFQHVEKQFRDYLQKLGIEEMNSVGEHFDPAKHEAVVYEKHQGTPSDVIFEAVRPGYTLHDKVIQVAQVKVAK